MKCKSNFIEESMYDVEIYVELKPFTVTREKKFDEDVDYSSKSSDESVISIHFDI